MPLKDTLKFQPVPRKVLKGRPAPKPEPVLLEKGRALVRQIVQQLKQSERS